MDRRTFMASAAMFSGLLGAARAQGPKSLKIGWLTAQQQASLVPYLEALRQGFAELGYVEGQNLTIEYRFGLAPSSFTP